MLSRLVSSRAALRHASALIRHASKDFAAETSLLTKPAHSVPNTNTIANRVTKKPTQGSNTKPKEVQKEDNSAKGYWSDQRNSLITTLIGTVFFGGVMNEVQNQQNTNSEAIKNINAAMGKISDSFGKLQELQQRLDSAQKNHKLLKKDIEEINLEALKLRNEFDNIETGVQVDLASSYPAGKPINVEEKEKKLASLRNVALTEIELIEETVKIVNAIKNGTEDQKEKAISKLNENMGKVFDDFESAANKGKDEERNIKKQKVCVNAVHVIPILQEFGKEKEADKLVERITKNDDLKKDMTFELSLSLSSYYLDKDEIGKASEFLEKAKDKEPISTDPMLYLVEGTILAKQTGKKDASLELLRKAEEGFKAEGNSLGASKAEEEKKELKRNNPKTLLSRVQSAAGSAFSAVTSITTTQTPQRTH